MRAELEAATDQLRRFTAEGGTIPDVPYHDLRAVEPSAPTPVDDLAKRIKMLRESGVRAYKDGPLEMVFAPAPKTSLTLEELMLRDRATADRGIEP